MIQVHKFDTIFQLRAGSDLETELNDHDVSPHSEQDQDSENDSDPETKLNNE